MTVGLPLLDICTAFSLGASDLNTTGVTGVSVRRYKAYIMYRAQIEVRGKTINLGEYKTLEDAAKARKTAEEKYFAPIIEDFYKNKP